VSVLTRLRKRLRDERGLTLIELMTGAAIGLVIIGVAFGLLEGVLRTFGTSEERVDVSQRGRLAVDQMSARLRSQVCGAGPTVANPDIAFTPATVQGTENKVAFWSNTGDGTGRQLRSIEYANGVINENIYSGSDPGGSPSSTRQLVSSVVANNGGRMFRYFAYNPDAWNRALNPRPALYLELSTPLSAADQRRVVRITYAYTAHPENGSASDPSAADFTGEFVSRTASSPYEYSELPQLTNLEPRCE
jgi:hypothetical protein